ncbi:MAG: helix-turn-helix transcriptional regulator [Ktedonobacteraceae bacterium]
MNRTDRLLAIVLELQGKGRQRAEDLAETFETSKRTIYRDIQALGEAGVPLVAVPGRGYALMKGYFLPPLSFNTEEATMLLLGSDFMAQNFDAQYRQAAQAASRKIEGVLPEKLRDDVHYLQSSIRFIGPGTAEDEREAAMIQQLRRAIIERTTVRFCYHTRYAQSGKSEQHTREADPYGLVHIRNSWHLVAYCHMRKDIRNFRLDRVDLLELLPATFTRPADFKMVARYHDESSSMVVRVLFDHEVARWVLEARSYYMTSTEETAEGLLVTLKVRQESEILQWLLSWGSHVRVLEPESLRKTLLEEARAILCHYTGEM